VNTFYTDFDRETYNGRSTTDYRSEFERDRDRIIYCSAFRRLQGKTQVFMSGEYDFYRTRLTHSIEVAQIGRSIVNYLNQHSEYLSRDFHLDSALVEVTCLAHDIGHPPFGHGGEKILNQIMAEYGGFEGNAQTLRILTEIFYESDEGRKGMKPTRALIDGIMKYKNLNSETPKDKRKFLYDDQKRFLEYVSGNGSYEEPLIQQSIECQIMEWADDTAYSLNDLLDGYKAGFLTVRSISQWVESRDLHQEEQKVIDELLQEIQREPEFEVYIANKVGEFIESVQLEKSAEHNWSNRYNFQLRRSEKFAMQSKLYKDLAIDIIFQSPQIQQLEAKGGRIIRELYHVLAHRYLDEANNYQLLPGRVAANIQSVNSRADKARILCDHIAGMTDGYATRMYKRIFDPDFGSIVDLI
jgi:dGTPase